MYCPYQTIPRAAATAHQIEKAPCWKKNRQGVSSYLHEIIACSQPTGRNFPGACNVKLRLCFPEPTRKISPGSINLPSKDFPQRDRWDPSPDWGCPEKSSERRACPKDPPWRDGWSGSLWCRKGSFGRSTSYPPPPAGCNRETQWSPVCCTPHIGGCPRFDADRAPSGTECAR